MRYAFDSSTKWVEIFVAYYSPPTTLLPHSSGLLHILLMQYFAFRFCVLSILLHARNIQRTLRSCHCSIIIVCPCCAIRYICREVWPQGRQDYYYTLALFTLQFIVPLLVLIFTYTRIAIAVWGKRPPGEAENSRDQRMARSKRKVSSKA